MWKIWQNWRFTNSFVKKTLPPPGSGAYRNTNTINCLYACTGMFQSMRFYDKLGIRYSLSVKEYRFVNTHTHTHTHTHTVCMHRYKHAAHTQFVHAHTCYTHTHCACTPINMLHTKCVHENKYTHAIHKHTHTQIHIWNKLPISQEHKKTGGH